MPVEPFCGRCRKNRFDRSQLLKKNLPVLWMALLVFGFTYLVTLAIYAVIKVFAVGERARSFKAVSPGLLPPLGIIFGLFVAFTAAQVWTDNEKARTESAGSPSS
jgi:hypothetical protein